MNNQLESESLTEYYNAQTCKFNYISGNPPEDSAMPVPWPYALSDGWSVEWDPSPANTGPSE
jgi:hypothetical protein